MTKIFCALDTPDFSLAHKLAAELSEVNGAGIKLGLEFFSYHGIAGVEKIRTEFDKLPLFGATNRINAYNPYLLMERDTQ